MASIRNSESPCIIVKPYPVKIAEEHDEEYDEADDYIDIETRNINNVQVSADNDFFYLIGELDDKEIEIKFSLKNLEHLKKISCGVFVKQNKE